MKVLPIVDRMRKMQTIHAHEGNKMPVHMYCFVQGKETSKVSHIINVVVDSTRFSIS